MEQSTVSLLVILPVTLVVVHLPRLLSLEAQVFQADNGNYAMIAALAKANHFRQLNIWRLAGRPEANFTRTSSGTWAEARLLKFLASHGVQAFAGSLTMDHLKKHRQCNQCYQLFIVPSLDSFTSELFDVSLQSLLKSTLIFLGQETFQADLEAMLAGQQKRNGLFYVTSPMPMSGTTDSPEMSNRLKVFSVFATKTFGVVNRAQLGPSGKIVDHFNLQSNIVEGLSIAQPPYIFLDSCDPQDGSRCSASGFFGDYMHELSRHFNFTMSLSSEPRDDWGTANLTQHLLRNSSSFGGVFGGIYYGLYDFSVGTWIWTRQRHDLADFYPVSSSSTVMALTPKALKTDFAFFSRPFSTSVWVVICLTGLLVFLVYLPQHLLLPTIDVSQLNANNIVSTSGWTYFLLLEAFYVAALTMTFMSGFVIPFGKDGTVRDVIKAFPEWKLIMMFGDDIYFTRRADEGDEDFGKFYYDRALKDPDSYVMRTPEEGLDRLRQSQSVLHIHDHSLFYTFKKNPFLTQEIKLFGRRDLTTTNWYCVLLARNSPLKALLKAVTPRMRDRGVLGRMMEEWAGKDIPTVQEIKKEVLGPGQTILVFVIMSATLVATTIILFTEMLIKKIQDKVSEDKQNCVDSNALHRLFCWRCRRRGQPQTSFPQIKKTSTAKPILTLHDMNRPDLLT